LRNSFPSAGIGKAAGFSEPCPVLPGETEGVMIIYDEAVEKAATFDDKRYGCSDLKVLRIA